MSAISRRNISFSPEGGLGGKAEHPPILEDGTVWEAGNTRNKLSLWGAEQRSMVPVEQAITGLWAQWEELE